MKQIFIQTPLNTMGFNGGKFEEDPKWLKARMKIMNSFTVKSLEAQTNPNFHWHILTRPETKEFIQELFTGTVGDVLTIDESEKIINEKAEKMVEEGEFELLLTRLNSDDCYHNEFINIVQNFHIKKETEALVFQCGYMWYQKEKIIVERRFPSPPFYSFIYNPAEYLMGKKYDVNGHNFIRIKLNTNALRERLWLWLVNDLNNKILRGGEYPDPIKYKRVGDNILKGFGL